MILLQKILQYHAKREEVVCEYADYRTKKERVEKVS